MNVLTQHTRERHLNPLFSSLFLLKAGWLFYAAGLLLYSAGVVYQFVWMRIFHALYDVPFSGDRFVSAAEVVVAKFPIKLVIYGGTYLLWGLGAGAICAGVLAYAWGSISNKFKHAAEGGRRSYHAFAYQISVISFLLSVALFDAALVYLKLWDRVFDQFVRTPVKLPVELVMHGGVFLLFGLSVGALIIALVGVVFWLISAIRTMLRGRWEHAHD